MIEHKTVEEFIKAFDTSDMAMNYELHDGDCTEDEEFSSRTCDGCGSYLAGSRHHLVGCSEPENPEDEPDKQWRDFKVCRDCYMFTMLAELPIHLPSEEESE